MKRILSLICVACIATGIHAQLVTSTSQSITKTEEVKVKKEKNKTWMLRAGIGTNNLAGDLEVDSKVGYFVGLEFNKQLGSGSNIGNAYWGMDFAFHSRGFKEEDDGYNYSYECKLTFHTFQWSPFIFGYKFNVTNDFSIDPHIGVYALFDMAGKAKITEEWDGEKEKYEEKIGDMDDVNRFDVGLKIGVGFWFKDRYSIDLTYQRGFINAFDYEVEYDEYYDYYDISCKTSNFWIRLGIAL